MLDATQDENTVMFAKKHNELVEKIKAKIEELQRMDTTTQPIIQAAFSAADEIKKYKELLDSGVITQDEFNAKKKELLGL